MVTMEKSNVDRSQKEEVVAELREALNEAGSFVVAHYSGLNVARMTDLRSRMREAGGTVKVAKNRLVKLALEGTDAAVASEFFQGPTVLVYSADPVAAPKIAVQFAKENDKFVILGGAMGATKLDDKGVKSLADLPSLDELRAKIVGTIAAPAGNLVRVIAAPAGDLARVIQAHADKNEAA